MARNGFSYLVVVGQSRGEFMTIDGISFSSELDMLRDLGVTGWELISIISAATETRYYFKRPRS